MDTSHQTRILPVNATNLGKLVLKNDSDFILDDWQFEFNENEDVVNLKLAAGSLRDSDIPVAFPTETVYGLGADATRSNAVLGIYKAKQRPSDNPLICHFASLQQLRDLLRPISNECSAEQLEDPIPPIYKSVIQKFWPGPLTIILPNPKNSPLAPEVTAGLHTFGARMPRNLLALLVIKLANVPVAAPSANASTKPSPTAAEHVKNDLHGRIDYILDGGPCDVGVESTVVDGLSDPPAILRPGGVSIEQLRSCAGWEDVVVGYKDAAEASGVPRAPGMKYRHYSPAASVLLYESNAISPTLETPRKQEMSSIGIVRTRKWEPAFVENPTSGSPLKVWDINLGPNVEDIARGLFSALRELDKKQVDVIFVEGIADEEGDVAAAVMNRLRKAAEVNVT
ncbi:translation factor [Tothia fuscella]|uniref:Threonylcarbamoyl-AMP synthase n=1 Tax=Tothia fuscella TaxID=1048955 RepID=A0A9P4NGQ7_9PEZI|nr:translation factor [Tothia fuscella]